MSDNRTIDNGALTDVELATKEVTHSGDANQNVQVVEIAIISGSEASYTVSPIVGGAGAVAAGVQRVTHASDDPVTTAVQLIDDAIKTDDAGFTVATHQVMMSGRLAVAIGSDPDAADAGDAAAPITNRHRVQFVIGGHPNVLTLKHTTITTAVTDAAIVTISTGSKICVTRLTVTLDNASTVFPTFICGFGTANTPTTTGVIASHGGIPAGGGFTVGDGSGVIGQGADNEDLRVTTTGNATGNGLQITVSYFTLPT